MFSRSAALYDALYATFKDYQTETARLRELIAERVPDARTLLDVACGTGVHLALLRQHFEGRRARHRPEAARDRARAASRASRCTKET